MSNLMDNISYTSLGPTQDNTFESILKQARQNPRAFEEHIKRTNPQAYQQALQLRNIASPQQVVMQMMQQRGINPNVLRMLDI